MTSTPSRPSRKVAWPLGYAVAVALPAALSTSVAYMTNKPFRARAANEGPPQRGGRKVPKLEPFAFDAFLDDHCETPSNAYRDVVCVLRRLAERKTPTAPWRQALGYVQIYDPYYCQGGVKRRLGRLGFEKVYNENVDFYKAIAESQVPDFDVLVTNPPFSERRHLATALEFAVQCGKPWLMILPVHTVFEDNFTEISGNLTSAGQPPFFVVPDKKYQFKTPAPLPPPPTENRPSVRGRSRISHTIWTIHGGSEPGLNEDLFNVAKRKCDGCQVIVSLKEMDPSNIPYRFSEEMRRNALALGVTPPD